MIGRGGEVLAGGGDVAIVHTGLAHAQAVHVFTPVWPLCVALFSGGSELFDIARFKAEEALADQQSAALKQRHKSGAAGGGRLSRGKRGAGGSAGGGGKSRKRARPVEASEGKAAPAGEASAVGVAGAEAAAPLPLQGPLGGEVWLWGCWAVGCGCRRLSVMLLCSTR